MYGTRVIVNFDFCAQYDEYKITPFNFISYIATFSTKRMFILGLIKLVLDKSDEMWRLYHYGGKTYSMRAPNLGVT